MSQTAWSRFVMARAGLSRTSLAAMIVAAGIGPALAQPTSPEGIWYTKDSESIIKVRPCKDAFCGMVVWLKEPTEADGSPKLDKLNTDPLKKNKPLIGLDVLLDMVPAGDHWKGRAYNADDGKFYDITFTVKSSKAANDKADLRGCILGFLCQTETFTRASEVPGGDPTLAMAPTTPGKTAKVHGAKKDSLNK